jgi:hypothetical protein
MSERLASRHCTLRSSWCVRILIDVNAQCELHVCTKKKSTKLQAKKWCALTTFHPIVLTCDVLYTDACAVVTTIVAHPQMLVNLCGLTVCTDEEWQTAAVPHSYRLWIKCVKAH